VLQSLLMLDQSTVSLNTCDVKFGSSGGLRAYVQSWSIKEMGSQSISNQIADFALIRSIDLPERSIKL
jgi:hypothetical protein